MELKDKFEEIVAVLEAARAMPMSASCIVNRVQILGLLDELRELIPTEVERAESVLHDRDEVVEKGRREAERIIADARDERLRLVTETEIYREAAAEAFRLREEADRDAYQVRQDVDEYADSKLANFEIVLNKTLAAVLRGRERLQGRHDMEELTEHHDDAPLPGA